MSENAPEKKSLAVLISGGGSNLQAVISSIKNGEINGFISVVISSNEFAYGLSRAAENNIPSFVFPLKDFSSPEERDKKILEILNEYKADYVILAGYLGILTPLFINAYKNKIINIHPSLLPLYGGDKCHGINVHKMVIAAREPFSGATVHFVDEGVDTGLIIAQKKVRVAKSDTPETLQKKILEKIEHELLIEVVKDLCADRIFIESGKVIKK